MSQKYDEYIEKLKVEAEKAYLQSSEVVPMVPEVDEELSREIRDRAIMSLIMKATKEGKELSYGDVREILDLDPSEKEYEKGKTNSGFTR